MVLILHPAQIYILFSPASTIGHFLMVNFHLYGNLISLAPQSTRPHAKVLNEAILSRDIRCRITNHIEGTECAPLVPRSESLWFQQNLMALYGKQPRPGCEPVDNPRNAILLRSDIHTSFDYKRFAFVPKPKLAECSTGSVAYVTHIFCSPEPHELSVLY